MQTRITAITQSHVQIAATYEEGTRLLDPEEYIIWAARVSSSNQDSNDNPAKLLNYLIKNRHWSPFEMVSVAWEIKTSRAIAQQILRHRSFSFQEFSQRYAEATKIESVELRMQAQTNRQSSTIPLPRDDAFYYRVHDLFKQAQLLYSDMVREGVAKECARFVLPLATQTTLVMHGTVRSWIHFFEQRCDEHAQKEIRCIAKQIRDEFADHFPNIIEAMEWENEVL